MKKRRSNSKTDWVIGTWRNAEAVSPVLFTIRKGPRGFRIQATDESDGEKLVVSNVKWDGETLSFETLTPSNSWRTKSSLKLVRRNRAVHELTFWETWKKVV